MRCRSNGVVDWAIEKKKKRIGVLGLSFKSNTDDLRESPIVKVVETLLGRGFSLAIYDSNVNLSKLVGANRSYIEQGNPPHLFTNEKPYRRGARPSDIILICNKGAGFDEVLKKLRQDQMVLDLVRISKESTLTAGLYEGISW